MNFNGRRSFGLNRSAWGVLPVTLLLACSAADGEDVLGSSFGVGEEPPSSGGVAGTGGSIGIGGKATGGFVGEGGSSGEEPPFFVESAFYQFNDCSAGSIVLVDSSPNALHATRSSSVTCATGLEGLAINIDGSKDIVSTPTVPELEFSSNAAVAAWVNLRSTKGTRLIAQSGDSKNNSFTLAIVDGILRFSVVLSNGQTFSSSAPVPKNEWVHVGGRYDGSFAFLYVNGERVGQVSAAGTLRPVADVVQIGGNGKTFFDGLIDNVWLSNNPIDEFEIIRLSCISRDPLVEVTPLTSGLVQPETPVDYQVHVTNRDIGGCFASDTFLQIDQVPPGFLITQGNNFDFLEPGQSTTFDVTVTGTVDADPGVTEIPFNVFAFGNEFRVVPGQLVYEMAEPTGCFVRTSRELMIRNVGVVDDPMRTTFDGDPNDPRTGAWTFAKLMRDMAPTPEQAADMVEAMVSTWLTDQTVNTFVAGARPSIQEQVLDPWPRTDDGKLDLEQAPLRLLAIVNRLDSRNLAQGHAGEGRFVFGVLNRQFGFEFPIEFTMIVEYRLPATTEADVQNWADSWHALGALPFPSEEYNTALQALTERFTGRGAEPGRPNGSALAQLRSNEIALGGEWQLREFNLSSESGMLVPATIKLTPDREFNFTTTLADFINENEAAILAEQHTVPESFQGTPFLSSHVENFLDTWFAGGDVNPEARHKFALNTCNGCHSGDETGTGFLHIVPREVGQESSLSGFLTGIDHFDPFTGEPRSFNDLKRRRLDLEAIVCGAPEPGVGTQSLQSTDAPVTVDLKKGIQRVH
jgi:hypothetical protein